MVFDSDPWTVAAERMPVVPIAAVIFYTAYFLHVQGGGTMPTVPSLRNVLLVWNVAMAVFSAWCAIIAVPHYLWGASGLLTAGFIPSICSNVRWYARGDIGLVAVAFTASKFVELGDTVFLALRKRPLTGLHTFHHAATLVLTWKLFSTRASTGLVFVAMNSFVHTIMYSYYAAMLFPGARGLLKHTSHWITSIQILQMVVGVFVNLLAARAILSHYPCQVSPTSVALAGLLYSIYFVLFVQFALERLKSKKA